MKFTRRDLKFFVIGITTLFLIETILGWNDVLKDMRRGYIEEYNARNKLLK